jgi:hypothetical protein
VWPLAEGRGGGAQDDAEVAASIGLAGRAMTREGEGKVTGSRDRHGVEEAESRGSHIGRRNDLRHTAIAVDHQVGAITNMVWLGRWLTLEMNLGAKEGDADGAKEGDADGTKEGDADGAKEGDADGAKEGDADGAKEGDADGTKEGDADGTKEGDADGEMVELLVGNGNSFISLSCKKKDRSESKDPKQRDI